MEHVSTRPGLPTSLSLSPGLNRPSLTLTAAPRQTRAHRADRGPRGWNAQALDPSQVQFPWWEALGPRDKAGSLPHSGITGLS